MPVPTAISDLSTTINSNSPAGVDNVFPDLDNYIRALSAFIAQLAAGSGFNGTVTFPASDVDGIDTLETTGTVNFGDGSAGSQTSGANIYANSGRCISMYNATADATAKAGRIAVRHYTNSEEDAAVIGASTAAGANVVAIGGGSTSLNAATEVAFYTATNTTTLTGTQRAKFDANGNFVFLATGTAPTLTENREVVFNVTSNTNLRISVRGNDGVTRVANITLA